MLQITLTYALGTVAMFFGSVVIAVGLDDHRRTEPKRYYSLLGVTAIATVAYAVMTLGLGSVSAQGQEVFVPRYIDWLLTTPLLILYIGLLAGADRRTLATAIGLDVGFIALGFLATVSAAPLKWVAFGLAGVAYLGTLYVLIRPMTDSARDRPSTDRALFEKLRNVIVLLWTVYPAVWLTGPPGSGITTAATMAIVIVYLDVVTKVGFAMIVLNAHGVFDRFWAGDETSMDRPAD